MVLNGVMTRYSPALIERFKIVLDSTDNIPGVEGVGETTAIKLLEQVADKLKLQKVIDVYCNKYGQIEGHDRFCETWMLVKMRFDRGGFEKEKIKTAYYLRDLLTK